MTEALESLLLNVLFLILFLFFVPILIELNKNKFVQSKKSWIANASAFLAIICCISYPIPIMEGYIFDLRLVALTLAGLYGGIKSSILLVIATLIFRFAIGGSGAIATIIVLTIQLLLLILLTSYFQRSSRKNKIIIGSLHSLGITIVAILNMNIIFGAAIDPFFVLAHTMISVATAALLIYMFEIMQENILIHKQVIKADKMEVVSHLASSVSHEVRNPLTVVRGFLQLMIQNEMSKEQRDKYLRISLEEIDRANEIIRNYLTFAKPSPENITKLNMKEEIERTIQIISPLANMNGVEIETSLMEVYSIGERQFFLQSLLNITKNCIEAMPESGTLSINVTIEKKQVHILIADTGKGMTKEQLARIGEPYFTTKGREGTGLGMMTAIKIIEAMHGRLHVTSIKNEGTSFHIYLPLTE